MRDLDLESLGSLNWEAKVNSDLLWREPWVGGKGVQFSTFSCRVLNWAEQEKDLGGWNCQFFAEVSSKDKGLLHMGDEAGLGIDR